MLGVPIFKKISFDFKNVNFINVGHTLLMRNFSPTSMPIFLGMGRDRFLARRDESRQLYRDETRFETKVETESIHIDTNRDFQYQKFSNSRQISRLEKSLSRMDETLNFFKFRDETGRDENSRLVSPRNQSRL